MIKLIDLLKEIKQEQTISPAQEKQAKELANILKNLKEDNKQDLYESTIKDAIEYIKKNALAPAVIAAALASLPPNTLNAQEIKVLKNIPTTTQTTTKTTIPQLVIVDTTAEKRQYTEEDGVIGSVTSTFTFPKAIEKTWLKRIDGTLVQTGAVYKGYAYVDKYLGNLGIDTTKMGEWDSFEKWMENTDISAVPGLEEKGYSGKISGNTAMDKEDKDIDLIVLQAYYDKNKEFFLFTEAGIQNRDQIIKNEKTIRSLIKMMQGIFKKIQTRTQEIHNDPEAASKKYNLPTSQYQWKTKPLPIQVITPASKK